MNLTERQRIQALRYSLDALATVGLGWAAVNGWSHMQAGDLTLSLHHASPDKVPTIIKDLVVPLVLSIAPLEAAELCHAWLSKYPRS